MARRKKDLLEIDTLGNEENGDERREEEREERENEGEEREAKIEKKRKEPSTKKTKGLIKELYIHELDPHSIRPITADDIKDGGSKLVVIGKPGTGKSTLIDSILYYKRHIFPVGEVQSGTEDSNSAWSKRFANIFIYPRLNEKAIEKTIQRQKIAKRHLKNPWAVYLLDDCTDDPKHLTKPLFQGIFKNGRHWAELFILSLQYCLDVKPVIRNAIDGVFILKESNPSVREKLWKNYGSAIPTLDLFNILMDALTDDFGALYINNRTSSNKLEDCVFYYKAPHPDSGKIPKDWKFGCPEYRRFSEERYNTEYTDPIF